MEKTSEASLKAGRKNNYYQRIPEVGSWNVDKWKNLKFVALSSHLNKVNNSVS